MPQVFLVLAPIFTHVGVAAGTAAAISASIVTSVVMTGVNFLVGKLTPKPKFDNVQSGDNRFEQVSVRATDAPRVVIYGQTRVGGALVAQFVSDNNQYLWRVFVVSGHELESINGIYFDDEEVTVDGSGNATGKYADVCWIYKKLGAAGEATFQPLLDAGLITANDKWDGLAAVLIKTKWNQDKFPNGYPQKVNFLVKGKKVYDPRDGQTKWTDNPALCFRDFMADARFGFGATSSELDDAAFITAANTCDELVALKAGGTIKRYLCNGGFSTEADLFEIGRGLLSSFAGKPSLVGGKIGVVAGAWIAPTITLSDDDFIGGLSVTTRRSRRELFNSVKGRYHNPNLNYQEDSYPSFQDEEYVAADGGQDFWTTLDLPFTTHPAIATRLAKIHLERHRHAVTSNGSYKLTGYQVQPPNTLYINHPRYGWSNKTFEVSECGLTVDRAEGKEGEENVPVMAVQLTLVEADASIYAWNPTEEEGTATTHTPSDTIDPTVVHTPTGVTLASGDANSVVIEGIRRPAIKVTWTPPSDQFVKEGGRYYFRIKETGGNYTQAGSASGDDSFFYLWSNVEVGKIYYVEMTTENSFGAKSAPAEFGPHTVTASPSERLQYLGQNGTISVSTILNGQGSIVPNQQVVISYSYTPSSITLTWNTQSLLRSDNSTFLLNSGSKSYVGLSSSTTYYMYPFIELSTYTVQFTNPDPPSTSRNGTYAVQTALDGRIPIPVISITTAAAGNPGGGGGGEIPCPEASELVNVQGRGDVPVSSVQPGEYVLGKCLSTGEDVHRKVIAISSDSCSAWRILDGHRVSPCEPVWHGNTWKPAFQASGAIFDTFNGVKVHLTVESDEYNESNFYLVSGTTPLLIHNQPIYS